MSTYLDIDDAVADHPRAKQELAELREKVRKLDELMWEARAVAEQKSECLEHEITVAANEHDKLEHSRMERNVLYAENLRLRTFLRKLDDGGMIVSSGQCSMETIARSNVCGRMYVDDRGFGYVYVGQLKLSDQVQVLAWEEGE